MQAWLRNNSPCTVYRVLGEEATNADASGANSRAGWVTDNTPNATLASAGGAYGLFLFPSGSTQHAGTRVTGTIGAIWYVDKGAVILSGSRAGSGADLADENAEGAGALFKSTGGLEFTAKILNQEGAVTKTSKFNSSPRTGQQLPFFSVILYNSFPILNSTTPLLQNIQSIASCAGDV